MNKDSLDETKVYDGKVFKEEFLVDTLKNIYQILEKRGYDALNQIVGYLVSGDPGYITSYMNARKMILQFERIQILEVLVKRGIM